MNINGWKTGGMAGWHFIKQENARVVKKYCTAWDKLESGTPITIVPYDSLKYRQDTFCIKCLESVWQEENKGID